MQTLGNHDGVPRPQIALAVLGPTKIEVIAKLPGMRKRRRHHAPYDFTDEPDDVQIEVKSRTAQMLKLPAHLCAFVSRW
jgi:hypothetical protein